MRIGFVVDKCAPFFVGGYENRVLALAGALSKTHEVRVFTSLVRSEATVDGVRFVRISPPTFQADASGGRSLAHSGLFALALVTYPEPIREWNPDILIVQAIPYLHLVTGGGWLSGDRCPVVLDVCEAWWSYPYGGGWTGSAATRLVRASLTRGVRRAAGIIAISKATRATLVHRYGVPPEQVTVVPLGIPSTPPGGSDGDLGAVVDVLYLNRMVREKRPLDLVAALAQLRSRGDWKGRAILAGSGPLLGEVRAAVRAADLGDQVEVPGFVNDRTRRDLLRRSRVFVLPSEREGFSLAALEALGAGIPVVAARPMWEEVFGVGDIVEDGVDGRVYPVGDTDRLADSLQALLTNERDRLEMARRGFEIAAGYHLDSVAAGLEQLLHQIVESARGSTVRGRND